MNDPRFILLDQMPRTLGFSAFAKTAISGLSARALRAISPASIVGVLLVVGSIFIEGGVASAERSEVFAARPAELKRNPAFVTPSDLRDRVDFWKRIKAKNSQYRSEIHHRWYPQAVYTTLDFTKEAREMSEQQLEKYRRKVFDQLKSELEKALRVLATGSMPSTALERRVYDWMAKVPGGLEKYKQVIDEDLIRSQRGIREKHEQALRRSGRYLPIIERIFVREYGLPIELSRLPFVESSFDYTAYSSAGAAGIWQFMPATGRLYMTVNRQLDERRDPIEATHAAAKYFRSAYGRIQNWPLAVTSYNHGVAGVVSKIRKLGTTDISEILERPRERLFGFASTNFYPSLLAAIEIYEERQEYFPSTQPEPALRIAMRELPSPMSTRYVMQTLGLTEEVMRSLNYGPLDQIWQGRAKLPRGYVLKVPIEYGNKLGLLDTPETSTRVTETAPSSSVYGGVVYKVRPGDSLGTIARKYKTTPEELRHLNDLPNDRIRIGQLLVVRPKEVQVATPTPRVAAVAPRATYKVRSGDTWWQIARTNGTTVEKLLKLNPKVGRTLRPGMLVRIQ